MFAQSRTSAQPNPFALPPQPQPKTVFGQRANAGAPSGGIGHTGAFTGTVQKDPRSSPFSPASQAFGVSGAQQPTSLYAAPAKTSTTTPTKTHFGLVQPTTSFTVPAPHARGFTAGAGKFTAAPRFTTSTSATPRGDGGVQWWKPATTDGQSSQTVQNPFAVQNDALSVTTANATSARWNNSVGTFGCCSNNNATGNAWGNTCDAVQPPQPNPFVVQTKKTNPPAATAGSWSWARPAATTTSFVFTNNGAVLTKTAVTATPRDTKPQFAPALWPTATRTSEKTAVTNAGDTKPQFALAVPPPPSKWPVAATATFEKNGVASSQNAPSFCQWGANGWPKTTHSFTLATQPFVQRSAPTADVSAPVTLSATAHDTTVHEYVNTANASQAPSTLMAAPDVDPYGKGLVGAGLLEMQVQAALEAAPCNGAVRVRMQAASPQKNRGPQSLALPLVGRRTRPGLSDGPMRSPSAEQRLVAFQRKMATTMTFKGTRALSTCTKPNTAATATENAGNAAFKFTSPLFRRTRTKIRPLAPSTSLSQTLRASANTAPVLSKRGYTTVPSLCELQRMTDAELARVEGFRVECTGRGSIEWIGETDVRGLNLDAIVDFGDDAFAVYTNIPENRKPVVGHGLNKPAVVQLENLFPCDGQGTNDFFTLLRDRAVAGGAHVLDYSRTTGVFRFRVEHF